MIVYPVLTEHAIESTASVFLEFADRALVSAYPFCVGRNPMRTLTWFAKHFGNRPVILDSGLFTFFRDARQNGKNPSRDYCDIYFERYKRVLSLIPDHWIIVEFDTHVFDLEVEPYRKWIADSGWADRTLHVWHNQDGWAQFPEYLRRFRRVAFSQEGLERTGHGVETIPTLLRATRNVRDNRHIHILGTAKERLFPLCHDGFSADATSWTNVAIFGETRCGEFRITYDPKSKKVNGPEDIMERVHRAMPSMMRWYRSHPQHRARRKIRINYMRQLAAGLIGHTRYVEKLRSRSPGFCPEVRDPLEYWKLKDAPRTKSTPAKD